MSEINHLTSGQGQDIKFIGMFNFYQGQAHISGLPGFLIFTDFTDFFYKYIDFFF